jgi:hypothetical protein
VSHRLPGHRARDDVGRVGARAPAIDTARVGIDDPVMRDARGLVAAALEVTVGMAELGEITSMASSRRPSSSTNRSGCTRVHASSSTSAGDSTSSPIRCSRTNGSSRRTSASTVRWCGRPGAGVTSSTPSTASCRRPASGSARTRSAVQRSVVCGARAAESREGVGVRGWGLGEMEGTAERRNGGRAEGGHGGPRSHPEPKARDLLTRSSNYASSIPRCTRDDPYWREPVAPCIFAHPPQTGAP